MALKSLDPRFRGDDGLEKRSRTHLAVMPANAGIQGFNEAWL